MCGITGCVQFKHPISHLLPVVEKMTATLTHRGPDDEQTWASEHVLFGHRRLAVIDVEYGRQPMTREWNGLRYTICYNGELYNTTDLRNELLKYGVQFTTTSDTEVLLYSYIIWKEACLERLNGIFAFAIADEERQCVLLARDRLGVKPLFYAETPEGLFFASEIKALLANPEIRPLITRQSLVEMFSVGPSRVPGSGVFHGIFEVRPAYALRMSREGKKFFRYWQVESQQHSDSFDETVEQVEWLVTDAVKRQLVSDVPLCTFLSGGLDSSIITAIAASSGNEALHTFSIDYEDNSTHFQSNAFQPTEDAEFIARMQKRFQTIHHSCVIPQQTLARALHAATCARDLPGMADIDSSLLWFSHEMKKEFTVALSGECADEIFGGYPWFHQPGVALQGGFPWIRSLDARQQLLRDDWRERLPLAEFNQHVFEQSLAEVPLLDGEGVAGDERRAMNYLNMIWFMTTLLDRKDRMSMAAGLEVRVPFADHRLVEYLWNVPWEMKTVDGVEKGLLRRAMAKWLPEEVLWRKKNPYPKTHHPVYAELVSEMLRVCLDDRESILHELFDRERLNSLVESRGESFTVPWFGQLMTGPQLLAYFVQVHQWAKTFHVEIRDSF